MRGEEWGRAPFGGGGSGERGIERRAVVTTNKARGVERRGGGRRRLSGIAGCWDGDGRIKNGDFGTSVFRAFKQGLSCGDYRK